MDLDEILFVDDEPSVLSAIERAFHRKFNIRVADSAEEGLSLVEEGDGYAVVVSDFQLPGSDGISFLTRVGEISPDSVRMMLTGSTQFETSIRAVNEGHVFRFLPKLVPWRSWRKPFLTAFISIA